MSGQALDVQDLKSKQQAAKPLPWRVHSTKTICDIFGPPLRDVNGVHVVAITTGRAKISDEDAAYIVAACNAAPQLLDLLERTAKHVDPDECYCNCRGPSALKNAQDGPCIYCALITDLRAAGIKR